MIVPINRRNLFELKNILIQEMPSHEAGINVNFDVFPVSMIIEKNSKCFMRIVEIKKNINILIPIENNFAYFSANST